MAKGLTASQQQLLGISRCAGTLHLEYHKLNSTTYQLLGREISLDEHGNTLTTTTIIDTFNRPAAHGKEHAAEHPTGTFTVTKEFYHWVEPAWVIDASKTQTRVEVKHIPASKWVPNHLVNPTAYTRHTFVASWDTVHFVWHYAEHVGALVAKPHKADTYHKQLHDDTKYDKHTYTYAWDGNGHWVEHHTTTGVVSLGHPLLYVYDHKVDDTLHQKMSERWVWDATLRRFDKVYSEHISYPRSTSPAENDKVWVPKVGHPQTMKRWEVHHVWKTAPDWEWVREDIDQHTDRTHPNNAYGWIVSGYTAKLHSYTYTFNKNGNDATQWVEIDRVINTIFASGTNSSVRYNVNSHGVASTSESHLKTINWTFDKVGAQWTSTTTYTAKHDVTQRATVGNGDHVDLTRFALSVKKFSRNLDIVLTINSGTVVGNAVVNKLPTGEGKFTIINNGEIQGAGGTSGAAGKDALTLHSDIHLVNNGHIRGGGGGGGKGKNGGDHTAYWFITISINSSVMANNGVMVYYTRLYTGSGNSPLAIKDATGKVTIVGEARTSNCGSRPGCTTQRTRTKSSVANFATPSIHHTGGVGGAGGRGQGYKNLPSLDGSNGGLSHPHGGHNGGKGGHGGNWGKAGVTPYAGGNGGALGHSIRGKSHIITSGSKIGHVDGVPV